MIEQLISHIQRYWYNYIKLALIYAMIFQMSFVFDFLWYDRTYTMIAVAFVYSVIIQVIFYKWHGVFRHLIDLIVTILVAMNYSKTWDNFATIDDMPFYIKVGYHFIDSWQFIAIAVSSVFVSKMIHYVTTTRSRYSIFFVLGLIVLLIVDSFSPIILWLHIITLVVLFLIWHMFWHYERIRERNEEEFEVLLQSPESLFSPVVIVVSFAIVVALILPYGPPLLEDPYALWKKSRGEEVPAFLGDKGFKSQVSRNQSRLSGYSRNTSFLGGGFDFNYETVMEITTQQKSYWRGETINYYNGVGWEDTTRDYNYSDLSPSTIIETNRPLATTKENVATVKVLRPVSYPVLFHASEVKQIDEVMYTFNNSDILGTISERHLYSTSPTNRRQVQYDVEMNFPGILLREKDHSIVYDESYHRIAFPSSYRVTSELLMLDIEKLVEAPSQISDAGLHDLYTGLPDTLPQEVIDLAKLITERANSDYEKAKLLEDYLKLNYAYANRPDEDKLTGEEDDFVYKFLFELYEGYCDYFSTAMAVMAKSLGMPARWVKGFAPGVNTSEQYLQQIPLPMDELEQLRISLSGGVYNVRNADAHSWVEIYFEGFGWLSFDPTPGFNYPYEYVSEQSAAMQLSQLSTVDDEEDISSTATKKSFSYFIPTLIIVGLILILVILLLWHKRARFNVLFVRLRYKKFTNNDRIVYKFNQFLRYCKRKGLVRDESQTVQDAIGNWAHGSKHWKRQLHELYQLFEKARYSSVQLDDKQVRNANELIKSLKKQWKT